MGCNRVFFWKRLVQKRGQQKNRINYYPFGLTFNSFKSGSDNQYLFNQGTGGKTHQGKEGKSFKTERQQELGWDMTKFRMYDYALGRFINVDPLADAAGQESWTPYHYVRNNPTNFNDPYGDCDWCLDALQVGLDVAGLVPLVGNVADLTNAGISFARGDNVGGALSLAAAVPGAGLVVGVGKTARTTLKIADKVNDVAKAADKLNDASKATNKATDVVSAAGHKIDPKTGQRITGSGKPAVHTVNKSSKKQAKDAARNDKANGAKGTSVKHTQDSKGGNHYHNGTGTTGKGSSTKDYGNNSGKKSNNVHYEYPKNGQ